MEEEFLKEISGHINRNNNKVVIKENNEND